MQICRFADLLHESYNHKMLLSFFKLALFLSLHVIVCGKLEVPNSESSDVAKTQLQKLHDQTKHMRYGECWTKALHILKSGCRHLTDENQRRIGYAFARCHMQASGRDIPECPKDKPMSFCTDSAAISDIAFNAYTEFFTHTQQICFHLQSQAWHEATENTIARLADNSAEVASHLEQSSKIAHEMITQQNLSLKNQEVLLQNEERLRHSMDKSVLDVQKSHAETKTIIQEQRALFSEVFDRVAILQKTVLGEFSSIYTFGFYVGSTVLAYVLTSTTRTNSARIWLFFILLINAAAERTLAQYYIEGGTGIEMGMMNRYIPELIYEQTWLCRRISSAFAALVLFASIFRYKDYNRINNSLLNEIKRQNQELQTYIKENIHVQSSTSSTMKSVELVPMETDLNDAKAGKRMLLEKHQSDISSVATLSHHDHNQTLCHSSFNTSSATNFDAFESDSETDRTFCNTEDNDSDVSVASVMTVSSYSTHSAQNGYRRSMSTRFNSSRRSSTPLRESLLTNIEESRVSTTTSFRKSRRSDNFLLESNKLSEIPEGVFVGGHNLRKRTGSPAFKRNPILEQETAEDFSEYIHGLAEQTNNRNRKITQHITQKHKWNSMHF